MACTMEERGGLLSRLVSMTDADPSLAQDLLEATDWDLEAAVAAYKGLSVTTQPHQFQEPGKTTPTLMSLYVCVCVYMY